MEKGYTFNINIDILPKNLDSIETHLYKYVNEHILNNIYKNAYIYEISKIEIREKPRVLISGHTRYASLVHCKGLSPEIDDVYTMQITSMNKMGFYIKKYKISIFIPTHYSHNIYDVGDPIKFQILAKKVEDSVVCVAKEVSNN